MVSEERIKYFEKVEGFLRDARAEIPVSHDARPSDERRTAPDYLGDTPEQLSQDFEGYVSENELELAWYALAALARLTNGNTSCWHLLPLPAAWMKLPDRAIEAANEADKAPEGGSILSAPLIHLEKREI